MKLKELLLKVLESRVERQPDESDEDFLARYANQSFKPIDPVTNRIPNMMKKKIVIPIPFKRK